jgi:hypothetical protein
VKIRNTGLSHPVDFSWSSEIEIDLCESESVIRFLHRSETIRGSIIRRKEVAVRLEVSSSDTPTELMELRQSESLGPLDTDHRRIRIIDSDFYD